MDTPVVKIKVSVTTQDGDTLYSEEYPNVPLGNLTAPGYETPGALTVATYLVQVALGDKATDPV